MRLTIWLNSLVNICLMCLFLQNTVQAQPYSITIDSCYKKASTYSPLAKQSELRNQMLELRKQNISTAYLPLIQLMGQVTYQSDVMQIDLPIPGVNIPTPDKDQYKLYLDVRQTLYDGGTTKARKNLEDADLIANTSATDVEIYKVKEQINQFYFAGLTIQLTISQLMEIKKELDERRKVVESGVRNGAVPTQNLLLLEAEILKTDQRLLELQNAYATSLDALSILTGDTFPTETQLTIPHENNIYTSITRPEYKLFDAQKNKFDVLSRMAKTQRMPKLVAFAQGGMAKPAFNMYSNEFEPYYIVGLQLQWNIWDWNQSRRDQRIYNLQSQIVDSQSNNFTNYRSISSNKEEKEIERLRQSLEIDKQIVEKYEQVVKLSASQLDQGTITSADYLRDLNAYTQAALNLQLNTIKLAQAQYGLRTIQGF